MRFTQWDSWQHIPPPPAFLKADGQKGGVESSKGKGTSQEAVAIMRLQDEGIWTQKGAAQVAKSWADSGFILKRAS